MKKFGKILLFILIIFIGLGLWILEPNSINPLKTPTDSLSNSISDLTCAESLIIREKADSLLNNSIILGDYIGTTVGMHSEECGTWVSVAGYKNKGQKVSPDENTKFRLASISKPITAVAIIQLWEKRLIDLDVKIQKYVPEFPESDKGEITIRQLLKHTSGVTHYKSTMDMVSFKRYDNMVEAMNKFKNNELLFKPGTSYNYTTYGYTVLGAVIENVSGLSFQDYIRQNIWGPAGMENTDIEDSKVDYENKAKLYIKWGSSYIKSPKTNLSIKYPGGGIQSTAGDLLKFGRAILNNELIDSSSLDLMISSTDTLKEGDPYGFGWFVLNSDSNGRIIQHGGSQSGASSFLRIYLDEEVVVASIANSLNSNEGTYFICRDLAELLIDSTYLDRPVHYFEKQPKSALKKLVGQYQNKDEILTISLKGTQLYSQLGRYPNLPVHPKSKAQFFSRHFDGKLTFDSSSEEKSEWVENIYRDETTRFIRIK